MSAGLPRKAWPTWLLRLAVALALLYFAFRAAMPDGDGSLVDRIAAAWVAPAPVAAAWLAVAFGILGVSFCVGALRFHGLLAAGGISSRYSVLLRAYLVAGFFNTVLPGAILGDAYRVWDVRSDSGRGSEALGLVVLERLLSLAALGCIGLVAAPFIPLSPGDAWLAALLVSLSSLFLIGTAAALWPPTSRALRRVVAAVLGRAPRIAGPMDRALAAVSGLSDRPAVIAIAFGWSLVSQFLPVLAAFALATPLAADVGLAWYAVIVPFVTLVALVPVSIGGAGLREYLYVALFGAVGMRSDVALSLSLSAFFVSLLWSAVGFGLFAAGRKERA